MKEQDLRKTKAWKNHFNLNIHKTKTTKNENNPLYTYSGVRHL
jgi:hypothetical protein